MSKILSLFSFLPLIARHCAEQQTLERQPEPVALTENEAAREYERAWESSLSIIYAIVLEQIHRARTERSGGLAIDLACGPGHLALAYARFLGCAKVLGVDLSSQMLELARLRARAAGREGQVTFERGDVTSLSFIPSRSAAVTTFTNGAHHLPDLDALARTLREMDRVTSPDGLILLADLVRLRSEAVTAGFIKRTGKVLLDAGLKTFYDDFRYSMRAAWTAEELRGCLPDDTERYWYHLVPRGLPATQIVIGLPEGRKDLFVRGGLPWEAGAHPVPPAMRGDWALLRLFLRAPATYVLRPAKEPLAKLSFAASV